MYHFFYFHQQHMTVPVALHSAQHLVLSVLGFDHSSRYLCGVPHFNWHFPTNLYCGCLFICLFTVCTSSLVTCLLRSLAHFLISQFVFFLLSFKRCLHILDKGLLLDMNNGYFCYSYLYSQTIKGEYAFLLSQLQNGSN